MKESIQLFWGTVSFLRSDVKYPVFSACLTQVYGFIYYFSNNKSCLMNIQSNKRMETFVIPGVLFFSVVILHNFVVV